MVERFQTPQAVVLYGAGGHARVVRDVLLAAGGEVACFVTDSPAADSYQGCALRAADTLRAGQAVVVCVGDCWTRRRIAERLAAQGLRFPVLVHPSAVVSPDAEIGEGTVVMPGAVINSGARVGRHCIINSGVIVEHECVIGDYAHLSPRATLCGRATVGEGTWVGAGTVAAQCVAIGAWSVVGAGSVVVRDVPSGVVAYGNPCRVRREVEHG